MGEVTQQTGPVLRIDKPHPKQAEFFKAKARHVALGGARGGGKSWAMRVKFVVLCLKYAALKCLLLRRTLPELRENHINPLRALLGNIATYSDEEKAFRFANGSRLKLGYCEHEADVYQYQGQEYDVVGFEEGTHFTEAQKDFILTCNRTTRTDFKPRAYYTANPGNVGHAWFKRLFVDRKYRQSERPEDYVFIPSRVFDNPTLVENDPEYVRLLENLPEQLRLAHLHGRWDVFAGQVFAEWDPDVHIVDPFPIPQHWRRWGGNDPGYSDPSVWYWAAADEDGNVFLYREATFERMAPSEQAKRVRALSVYQGADGKEHPEEVAYWVTGMDAFVKHAETGKGPADYYHEGGLSGFIEPDHGPGARSRMVSVFHEYLKPFDGPKGKKVARLRIFKTCAKLIETLPTLVQDETRREEIAKECKEDHWYQCAGYTLQAWHARRSAPPEKQLGANTLGRMLDHDDPDGKEERRERLRKQIGDYADFLDDD